MATRDPESVPKAMQATFDAVVKETDAICAEHLDAEYAQLARKMTAALCRKRPSPIHGGTLNGWVAGILYALGRVNFLFDRSQTPYLRADDLCDICGVSKNTGASKAKLIENALKIKMWDPEWFRRSRMEHHPMAWMVSLNGFIVDARHLPREIQEDAFKRGLIPYLPDQGGEEQHP